MAFSLQAASSLDRARLTGLNPQVITLLRLPIFLLLTWQIPQQHAAAGGVTLITHGFNSSIEGWVIGMANQIPGYPGFPGTNFTCYEIAITQNGQGQFVATPTLRAGSPPFSTDSGEIIIKLDWSSLSTGTVPTTTIASTAANALLASNFIPALAGHPLVELPLHFAGHSRGASVITEMARLLGAQGIWIDQATTLDPAPVSLFGDPDMKNYANILFADNYWQNLGSPAGQSIPAAYNRQLTNLTGGNTLSHSDVHLWYHGTVQLSTPASDTEATITNAERQAWWTPLESEGTNAGFRYSLIGGGDRLSSLEPAGAGNGRIRDGFNQVWDLGAGTALTNRTRLTVNNAAWPNLLRLNRSTTNALTPGSPLPLTLYSQSGSSTSSVATLQFALDPDANPYNANEITFYSGTLAGSGTNNVSFGSLSPTLPAGIPNGTYRVLGALSSSGHTRLLYAPERLVITAPTQPLVLTYARIETSSFVFTVLGNPGQKVVIESSTNLATWTPFQTNTLVNGAIDVTDPLGRIARFYRAVKQL